jgi:hypothetical protein
MFVLLRCLLSVVEMEVEVVMLSVGLRQCGVLWVCVLWCFVPFDRMVCDCL